MSELEPKTKRLIELASQAADPHPAVEGRVLSRIIDALEFGPPPEGGTPADGPGPAAAPAAGLAAKVAVVLLPIAAGVGLVASRPEPTGTGRSSASVTTAAKPNAAPLPSSGTPPGSRPPGVTTRIEAAVQAPSEPVVDAATAPRRPPRAKPSPSSSRRSRSTPRAEHRPSSDSGGAETLTAELEAVSSAQRALRSSKPQDALRRSKDYQRRFPAGQLSDEAAAIEILALCAMGALEEARTQARAFGVLFPKSLQRAKVDRSCAAADAQ